MANAWEADEVVTDWQADPVVEQPKPAVTMSQARGRKLPPLWETDVMVDGQPQRIKGVYDEEANAYLVPSADGKGSQMVMKHKDGVLRLAPYTGKPSSTKGGGVMTLPVVGDVDIGENTQNTLAGAGKAFVDTGRFVKQVATLGDDEVMADIRDSRARDAELMDTKAGVAGNIIGNVAMVAGGGTALRGGAMAAGKLAQVAQAGNAGRVASAASKTARGLEAAGRTVIAPKTLPQAATVGAAVGAAQPFDSAMDLLKNAGMGLAAGGAGHMLVRSVAMAPKTTLATIAGALGAWNPLESDAGLVERVGESAALAAAIAAGGAKVAKGVAARARDANLSPKQLDDLTKQSAYDNGIAWLRLPEAQREQMKALVREALDVPEPANAEAAERIARAKMHGVTLKPSDANKDVAKQRAEEVILPDSPELLAQRNTNRQALTDRVNEMVEDTRAPSGGDIMAAGTSQQEGMRAMAGASERAYKAAYKAAEDEAGDTLLDPMPIVRFVKGEKGTDGYEATLNKLKEIDALVPVSKVGAKNANGIVIDGQAYQVNPVPARELYRVRSKASELQKSPTTASHGANAKREIDAVYDASGIDQYQEAAALRRAHAKQFKEREAPRRLVDKQGQENAIRDEDKVVPFLLRMSPERISQYKQALVEGNEKLLKPIFRADKDARRLGIKSARDLKAAALKDVVDTSLVDDMKTGSKTIDPETLVRRYYAMGGGKADVAHAKWRAILGPKMHDRLRSIVQTSEDLTVPRGAKALGSARHLAAITRGLTDLFGMVAKVPGVKEGVNRVGGIIAARPAKLAAKEKIGVPSLALAVPVAENR